MTEQVVVPFVIEISPEVQGRINRYKAKRSALDELRTIALEAREESDRLDRELAAEEQHVERLRAELLAELADIAGVDEPTPKEEAAEDAEAAAWVAKGGLDRLRARE